MGSNKPAVLFPFPETLSGYRDDLSTLQQLLTTTYTPHFDAARACPPLLLASFGLFERHIV
jgi:hypothetical protein